MKCLFYYRQSIYFARLLASLHPEVPKIEARGVYVITASPVQVQLQPLFHVFPLTVTIVANKNTTWCRGSEERNSFIKSTNVILHVKQ